MSALDYLAEAQSSVVPKFRTGGIAAELFPTPVELAAVICACRDRGLSFKTTMGNVLTLTPPLVVTAAEMMQALDIVERVIVGE